MRAMWISGLEVRRFREGRPGQKKKTEGQYTEEGDDQQAHGELGKPIENGLTRQKRQSGKVTGHRPTFRHLARTENGTGSIHSY